MINEKRRKQLRDAQKRWIAKPGNRAKRHAYAQTPGAVANFKRAQQRYATTENGKCVRNRATRKWLKANRPSVNAYTRARARRQKAMVTEIKLNRGCCDCGFKASSFALDFDHRDPGTKEFSISKGYGQVSDRRLLIEIAKCDVRCANCHRIRTFQR